jgi:predicted dehydrogenase
MSAPLRLGIVGAGGIAGAYASAIAQDDSVHLVAVADTNPEAAAKLAGPAGAQVFASHAALLESGLCDGVIVSTPPSAHEAMVLDFIGQGIPVLCEKPFAIEGASARRMAEAASRQGVLVAMASKFRYVDDLHRAREMVAGGEIDDLRLIENVFTGVVDMTRRWNATRQVSGGGVFIDNGTHSADIVRFVAGPVHSVAAVPGPRIQPLAVEDHVFASMRTDSGVLARIETSWSLHKDRFDYLGLYGAGGTIELGWKGSRIRRTPTGPWEAFGTGYDKVAAFGGQVADFAQAIRGGRTRCLGTLDDAIASVDAISAGYASIADSGRWVAMKEVFTRPRLEVLEAVS